MDKSNQVLKKNFVNVFCNMTKVCKDTLTGVNANYHQGRKDAFEEILAWFNSSEKAVSANSFSLFLQDKLNKLKTEDEEEKEMKPIFDMSEIRYDLFSSSNYNNNYLGNQNSNSLSCNANSVQQHNTSTNNCSISFHRRKNR